MKYKQMVEGLPKLTLDQDALSVRDLLGLMPVGENAVRRYISRKVEDGEWEGVHKRVGKRIVRAYRPTRPVGKRRAVG